MFLPLGTDRPLQRPTLATYVLIGLNVAVFAAQIIVKRFYPPETLDAMIGAAALFPQAIKPWSFITYQFLHDYTDGWFFLHIAGNMLFLWVFGPNVEDRLGRAGFTIFYLLGGVAAGAAHVLFETAWVIGASGSIAAVTGAYLVLFPRTHVKTLIIFFFIGVFMIPAPWYIGFQVFWDLLRTGFNASGTTATLAHLGGYAFGAGVAMALLAFKIIPREAYDLFSIGKQAHRRRQFKEAGRASKRAIEAGVGVHKGAKAKGAKSIELPEAAEEARAAVARLVSVEKFEEASAAYRSLLDTYGHHKRAGVLGRRAQLELCKGLFTVGDHDMAASACERFVEAYPTDDETPSLKLMLGLIKARYLNDPVAAKSLVREAKEQVRTDEERELAGVILEELG